MKKIRKIKSENEIDCENEKCLIHWSKIDIFSFRLKITVFRFDNKLCFLNMKSKARQQKKQKLKKKWWKTKKKWEWKNEMNWDEVKWKWIKWLIKIFNEFKVHQMILTF